MQSSSPAVHGLVGDPLQIHADQIFRTTTGLRRSRDWHILNVYAIGRWCWERSMQRKAKIFMNNRSQAVRLPKEFQFKTREVYIRRLGSDVVLSSRPLDWSSYLAEAPAASENFMESVEDLPVQERES